MSLLTLGLISFYWLANLPPTVKVQFCQFSRNTKESHWWCKSNQSLLFQHSGVRLIWEHAGQPSRGQTMNQRKASDYIGTFGRYLHHSPRKCKRSHQLKCHLYGFQASSPLHSQTHSLYGSSCSWDQMIVPLPSCIWVHSIDKAYDTVHKVQTHPDLGK